MKWAINFTESAQKDLKKLDREVVKRILKILFERISILDNPRSLGATACLLPEGEGGFAKRRRMREAQLNSK